VIGQFVFFIANMEWTDENVDELIATYEHSLCLFDVFCNDYHSRLLKQAKMAEIAKKLCNLGKLTNCCTSHACPFLSVARRLIEKKQSQYPLVHCFLSSRANLLLKISAVNSWELWCGGTAVFSRVYFLACVANRNIFETASER